MHFTKNFGKNVTYDTLKSHKKQRFTHSLENAFLEKS